MAIRDQLTNLPAAAKLYWCEDGQVHIVSAFGDLWCDQLLGVEDPADRAKVDTLCSQCRDAYDEEYADPEEG